MGAPPPVTVSLASSGVSNSVSFLNVSGYSRHRTSHHPRMPCLPCAWLLTFHGTICEHVFFMTRYFRNPLFINIHTSWKCDWIIFTSKGRDHLRRQTNWCLTVYSYYWSTFIHYWLLSEIIKVGDFGQKYILFLLTPSLLLKSCKI